MSSVFLKSLKSRFAGKELEIIVRQVDSEENHPQKGRNQMLEMIKNNRMAAPVLPADIDIQRLIEEAQYPAN